ncbi:alpha-2-macroglobulin family protein [Natronoflexus pectinivorans]|nr:MG2 domain-containing protein [Natronoflexus pectinivorans]
MISTYRPLCMWTVLLFICVVFSCKRSQSPAPGESLPEVIYSEEIVREISFVTSGDVRSSDIVRVVFNNPIVDEEKIGSTPGNVFTFNPRVRGDAVWTSAHTLEFQPENGLPSRTVIKGVLNLQQLSDDFKEKKLENLEFYLNVLGRNLSNFSGTLELIDRNEPKELIYRGVVLFSEPTDLDVLKKSASLQGDKEIKLNWSRLSDTQFQFVSDKIIRTDRNRRYTFSINRRDLDLSENYTETFEVSPLKKMVTGEFRVDESGRSAAVRIGFSDELDIDQHMDGLISIEPDVDFQVRKMGNMLSIDGGFKFGSSYKVTVQPGIRSRWGTVTDSKVTRELRFSDIPPQLEFASDGVILPQSNQKRVQFYTTNLKRVHLEVKKVYTSQIGAFLNSSQLRSERNRNRGFGDHYSGSVGVIVKNQTIELADKPNEWVLNEFDLSELFSKYDDGLFLIRINFNPGDVSQPIEGDILDYIDEKGQIYKPVFLSDLGITAKALDGSVVAFVTDILTGKPLSNINVELLNYGGSIIQNGRTNQQGVIRFETTGYFYYITARRGKQISAISRNEMKWSNSGFDVGGISENHHGVRGFIYTERGVYRPGDSINIGFIAKNRDNTFPANHPVSITVRNPQYRIVHEQTQVRSTDGMYVFSMQTEESAPTGTYNVQINAGGAHFYDQLKIETVVAEQLRVQVRPAKRTFNWNDRVIGFDVDVQYLFGAPAPNLQTDVNIEVHPHEMKFPRYLNYNFSRADVDFRSFTHNVLKGRLDNDGKLKGEWILPSLGDVPSALKLKISATVLEQGGQPNEGWNVSDLHVYPGYVGIQDPSGYGYHQTGSEVRFPVVLLDPDGNRLNGRQLNYRVYRNDRRWWYQYRDRRSYQLKYKEDTQTYIVSEGSLTLGDGLNHVSFTPSENGEYLIEVMDGGNGHVSSLFFSAYRYGGIPGGDMNEGTLSLKSDKQVYSSGETARIMLPNPKQGNVLVTLERGRRMLDWFWVDPSKTSGDELVIDIPLKKDYLPNVYVTVSVIQPHSQMVNDRPIRMFGIIPLRIEDAETKIEFDISTKEVLSPNEDFEVVISTRNRQPAQFTIAVVDEGLLSLTQFRTPNPWREFYKKIGLFVETFDIFSHVMSVNRDDVLQTFSIGGADDLDYRESQLDPVDGKRRFEPVSMFKGPIKTDSRGRATVKFHMPNYNGAVRVMVIGTEKGSFGHAEKTIPVRSDIIMQANMPRVLKPSDEFEIPVSLFNMVSSVRQARFTIRTEGPLEVVGNQSVDVDFSNSNEALIKFKVRAKEEIGQAKIVLEGVSGDIRVENETNIRVVPSSVRVYDKKTERAEKGSTIRMRVPAVGVAGTNNASLDINIFPNMDFDHRLRWLIRYPYGCLEQTTSALFPQLYLKKMGYFNAEERNSIDENLNAGINRLQQFMLQNGAFAYWPGNTTACEWSSNYASHFLVEARALGYSVPDFLYNNAINGMESQARRHQGRLTTRAYRAFVLALAGRQSMAEMNMLMENELDKLNNASRWMLAAAYHLVGAENIRDRILADAGTTTEIYEPFYYNFGSSHRDDAIILYCATLMKMENVAGTIAESVAAVLSGTDFLSTQSSGYMLLALGRYFDSIGLDVGGDQIITGHVLLADGRKIEFNKKGRTVIPIRDNFNRDIEIHLAGSSDVDQVFAGLSWNGVPLKDESEPVANNLKLEVNWYDENGRLINPGSLKQGDTFYGRFTVSNSSPLSRVSEIALMQILPSGWQIENIRLNNTVLPEWTQRWNLNKEVYQDIRDDRIMWFFDLRERDSLDFVVKLNCVTAGSYWLPGTLVEAMYNNDFKATTSGRKVYVEAFEKD